MVLNLIKIKILLYLLKEENACRIQSTAVCKSFKNNDRNNSYKNYNYINK